MNLFYYETWFYIYFVLMIVFGVIATASIIATIYYLLHPESRWVEDDPNDPYGTVPPAYICLTLAIAFGLCTYCMVANNYGERNLVNLTGDLHSTQIHLRAKCSNPDALGCPSMFKQYRADSLWLEQRLDKLGYKPKK